MMILGVMAAVWGENDALLEEMRGVGAKAGELIDTKFGEIEILAKKYQNIPGAVILGRGISYSIALEAALKMLETNKLKMKGYPHLRLPSRTYRSG